MSLCADAQRSALRRFLTFSLLEPPPGPTAFCQELRCFPGLHAGLNWLQLTSPAQLPGSPQPGTAFYSRGFCPAAQHPACCREVTLHWLWTRAVMTACNTSARGSETSLVTERCKQATRVVVAVVSLFLVPLQDSCGCCSYPLLRLCVENLLTNCSVSWAFFHNGCQHKVG